MSQITKVRNDIFIIEKNYPQYKLLGTAHENGVQVYVAKNINDNTEEKLAIGVDNDGTRKLCTFNFSENKWELVGELIDENHL